MTINEQRQLRAAKARRLEKALGKYITVLYDANESGQTEFCLNIATGILAYRTAPNAIFDNEINVSDYAPQLGLIGYYMNMGLLVPRND